MASTRMVFLDVDGTIIDHAQRLRPSVVSAVQGARAAGHLVYVCTGRGSKEIPATVLDIGFDGVISAGGGFIEHDGDVLARHTMTDEAVADLVAFFEAEDVEYNLQGYDDVYPSPGLIERIVPMFAREGMVSPDAAASADMERLRMRMTYRGPAPAGSVAKATFFGTHQSTFARVRDGLGDRFHVITGTIPYLGEAGGEISPAGVNKGAAIAELVAHLGRSIDDTIGIGDSYNDLEMLQICGVGIAMGNADDAVKSHANEVTTSVAEDGVWNAFQRHGLI
ncbi:hypothetical protein FHX48_000138 [Microbacterium halimionae]|uniref:Cof-type HAD-IIB family hydrolase n=1 Tax=Microbacterium halimionae TaxID=1526413 RepID=A0A7W3JLP8_9MICO|nr:Cof-type HAD-IIB family hydrolase [Microbacterium halimionae]MBA8815086.1 hypothetical protein [Microbacterium halimionae]NII94123.1 hypothetical protein [Microbacterium halimionae]